MRSYSRVALVVIMFLVSIGAQTSYGFKDPLDTDAVLSHLAEKSLLNSVVSAGDRLVAVGQRGHILYSDNEGQTWQQAYVPVSSDLTDVHFPTPKHGWAVGHDSVVLKTTDGGTTWEKQLDGRHFDQLFEGFSIPEEVIDFEFEMLQMAIDRFRMQGPENPFLSVWFEDESNGFVFGVFNLILRTTDGGKSWSPWIAKTENPDELHFYSAQRVGEELYVVGERGLVLRFDQGVGRFLDVSAPYQGTLFGLTGNNDVLIVFGLRGHIFRSVNKGVSWTEVESNLSVSLTGSAVMPNGIIVLVGQNGSMLRSFDNGATFLAVLPGMSMPATDIIALTANKVLVAGPRGLVIQSLDPQAITYNHK